MKTFTILMVRTYKTTFSVEAENEEDAINKFHEMDIDINAEELEQCNSETEKLVAIENKKP